MEPLIQRDRKFVLVDKSFPVNNNCVVLVQYTELVTLFLKKKQLVNITQSPETTVWQYQGAPAGGSISTQHFNIWVNAENKTWTLDIKLWNPTDYLMM